MPDTDDHVLESVEEHHVVVWMLSELKKLDPADEHYDAKMTVLMENVRHHVEEEEQEWFPPGPRGPGPQAAAGAGRADGPGQERRAPGPPEDPQRHPMTT
ncbi:hypothetical protein GCM10020001_100080 [Nonomuraea salmonea]